VKQLSVNLYIYFANSNSKLTRTDLLTKCETITLIILEFSGVLKIAKLNYCVWYLYCLFICFNTFTYYIRIYNLFIKSDDY